MSTSHDSNRRPHASVPCDELEWISALYGRELRALGPEGERCRKRALLRGLAEVESELIRREMERGRVLEVVR